MSAVAEVHTEHDSPAELRKKFKQAQARVEKAITHYSQLMSKYDTNSNFRYIDQTPNQRGKADCQLVLGRVLRETALLEPKGSTKWSEGLTTATESCQTAYMAYSDLVGKRAKRGMAHCLRTMGRIKEDRGDLKGARAEWRKALALYQENGDSVLEAETTKEIDDISLEMDRVAVFKQKMTEMKLVDSKEEQAVRAAFEKFDADRSGFMDMTEYNQLAVELGTFPPLSEEELEEALLQLDNSEDGQISFEEFWTWWVTDLILKDK